MVCREPLAFKAATLGQNAVAREARSDGRVLWFYGFRVLDFAEALS